VTRIRPDTVRIVEAEHLPGRWATAMAEALSASMTAPECELLEDRVVSLGHGVQLAHLRHHGVDQPTLGAWKAQNVGSEDETWLWLVVLIPAGDPSLHLGWMAHLAAGLHDEKCRADLREATDPELLLKSLDTMVSDQSPHHHHSKRLPVVEQPAVGTTAEHRLIVAILKEVEFVDHLLALFVDHDVRGATVLEARGMAEHLAAHMSLFAGFRSAFKAVGHSQVLLTVVPADRTAEVLDLIRIAAGGMTAPGSGIAFALDVPAAIGLDKGHSLEL
jgi:hypothetical protein